MPPAVVKPPPAQRSLPETASAYTSSFIPEPSADQLFPSHLAMLAAGLPPAVEKSPPAYNVLPDIASASTDGPSPSEPAPEIPEPRADQLLPFHLAMLLAGLPPAVVKLPPA